MNIRNIIRTNQEKTAEVQRLLRESLPIFRELQLMLVRLVTLNLNVEDVIGKVNRYYGVDIMARRENGKLFQTNDIVVPRHLVRYILYEYSPMTAEEIAIATGSIDKHSIVPSSVRVVKHMLTYDSNIRMALYSIMEELIQEYDLVQPVHKIYRTKKLSNNNQIKEVDTMEYRCIKQFRASNKRYYAIGDKIPHSEYANLTVIDRNNFAEQWNFENHENAAVKKRREEEARMKKQLDEEEDERRRRRDEEDRCRIVNESTTLDDYSYGGSTPDSTPETRNDDFSYGGGSSEGGGSSGGWSDNS